MERSAEDVDNSQKNFFQKKKKCVVTHMAVFGPFWVSKVDHIVPKTEFVF